MILCGQLGKRVMLEDGLSPFEQDIKIILESAGDASNKSKIIDNIKNAIAKIVNYIRDLIGNLNKRFIRYVNDANNQKIDEFIANESKIKETLIGKNVSLRKLNTGLSIPNSTVLLKQVDEYINPLILEHGNSTQISSLYDAVHSKAIDSIMRDIVSKAFKKDTVISVYSDMKSELISNPEVVKITDSLADDMIKFVKNRHSLINERLASHKSDMGYLDKMTQELSHIQESLSKECENGNINDEDAKKVVQLCGKRASILSQCSSIINNISCIYINSILNITSGYISYMGGTGFIYADVKKV